MQADALSGSKATPAGAADLRVDVVRESDLTSPPPVKPAQAVSSCLRNNHPAVTPLVGLHSVQLVTPGI